jgi:HSP20 family molecular chaperone IbpA
MSLEPKRSNREGTNPHSEMPIPHVSGWNVVAASIEPLYNLMVGATEIILTIDLPYVNQEQVKLFCPATDVIEISAETSRKITFKDLGFKHRHGEFTSYRARIRTPVPVDESRIKKHFKRGVLEIHLPRVR